MYVKNLQKSIDEKLLFVYIYFKLKIKMNIVIIFDISKYPVREKKRRVMLFTAYRKSSAD